MTNRLAGRGLASSVAARAVAIGLMTLAAPWAGAAAQWPVGQATAYPYLFTSPNQSGTLGGVSCGTLAQGNGPQVATMTCTPRTADELLTGSYTATATASAVAGGPLRARAHLEGTVRVGYVYFNDIVTSYYDQVTITPLGGVAPSVVRFNFSLDGSGMASTSPSMGAGQDGNGYPYWSYLELRTFPSPGRQPTSTIYHDGTQPMVVGSLDIPFTDFTNGALTYSLYMAVLNRVYTSNSGLPDGTPVNVVRDADYSDTGQLGALQVFDAAGADITASTRIQFASAPLQAVPEPATIALVATGLVGVAAGRRRRVGPGPR